MEHFLHLSSEKQHNIINAALHSFGKNGYKKASISDIAKAAGISKAMIFHYFGCKKTLYLYLIEVCANVMIEGVMSRLDKTETDFFKRIRHISEMKMLVVKEYPDLFTFMENMYFETDPEVMPEVQKMLSSSRENLDILQFFEGVDFSRFKDNIDPMVVIKVLLYFSEGCIKQKSQDGKMDIEAVMQEYDECLNLFKNNFYKGGN